MKSSSVNFPAVSLCPLFPMQMVPVECVKEIASVETDDCLPYVYSILYNLEGSAHTCYTFNDPAQFGKSPYYANTLDNELTIGAFLNQSLVPEGEPIGVIVMIHPQGTPPTIEETSSFVANIDTTMEVWIQCHNYTLINGTSFTDYVASASGAKLNPEPDEPSVVDIDIVFTGSIGVYQHSEYYSYTPNNWIGEVGGLACLLLILHGVFVYLVMLAIAPIYRRYTGDYGSKFKEQKDIDLPKQLD